jgi:pyruvate,water dikinase
MLTSNLFKRWTYKFFAPEILQRGKYEAFKRLLENDRRCHELIADFQDLYFKKDPTEWTRVTSLYNLLSEAVGAVAHELSLMSDRSTGDLTTYYKKFDSYIRFLLQPQSQSTGPPYTICMGDPGIKLQLVGNKAKNLIEVYQKFDCSVPAGFIVTTNSWNALSNRMGCAR